MSKRTKKVGITGKYGTRYVCSKGAAHAQSSTDPANSQY